MKNKLLILLGITLVLCLIPTTTAFAKTVKAKSVSVAPKTMTLAVGDVAQLTATKKPAKASDKLTWTSSDESIATVSSKGVVQGVAEGTAIITVKTTNKKTAKCNVIVRDYATKADLTDSLIKQLSPTFATKEELKQNYYSKSEIDDKLKALPSGSGSSCGCAVRTTNDVVNILKENTYTKSEIDSKISGNDWGDEADVPWLNKSTPSKTFVITKKVKNDSYDISITIDSISCKKYKVMDYIKEENQPERFAFYKYVFNISYNIEGFEALHEAEIQYFEDDFRYPFGYILMATGSSEADSLQVNLDYKNTQASFTRYDNKDYDSVFLETANLDF